jgi:hypothetical protein
MLHPTTEAVAKALTGYVPFSEEDATEQFQADCNFEPKLVKLGDLSTYPRNGSVYKDKHGILQCYWKPKGGNYTEEEKDSLQGWYEVPSNEDIEEWALDSFCFTPGDDEVEPDHPDSWLSLLGLI